MHLEKLSGFLVFQEPKKKKKERQKKKAIRLLMRLKARVK